MSSTQIPLHPTSQTVAQLLPKLHDVDPDYRFMSLNDIFQVLTIGKQDLLHNDFNTAARAVDGIVKTLDDQNGEVQSLAIKCLTPLVNKIPSSILAPLIEKLSTLTAKNSIDNSITAMALRTVIVALPRPVSGVHPTKEVVEAYSTISRVLIPRLVGQLVDTKAKYPNLSHIITSSGALHIDTNSDVNPETVNVLIEVVRCFGPLLQKSEITALKSVLFSIVDTDRASSSAKKRAVIALSILGIYLTDEGLCDFVTQLAQRLRNPPTLHRRKIFVSILGHLARSIPSRFGIYVKTLAPFVLSVLNEQDFTEQSDNSAEDEENDHEKNDVLEAALIALDGFLSSCANEMLVFTEDVMSALFRFIKYDPNYNDDSDDLMSDAQSDCNDNEFSDDDDFEADTDFDDDDDDSSWKVRRCAAKALYTLISTRGSGDLLEDGTLFAKIAPVLIQRFAEREESVRLEIISTIASLIRKIGEISYVNLSSDDFSSYTGSISYSRKRRRESSSKDFEPKDILSLSAGLVSPVADTIPATGPRAELAKLSPIITKASIKLLRSSSIPTKQAIVNLLDDVVSAHHGGLSEYFGQLVHPIIDAIKPTSTTSNTLGTASATANTLRIAALELIGDIISTHSSSILHSHLDLIIPAVIVAINDKYYKISSKAVETIEQLVKALTPPRSKAVNQRTKSDIEKLYKTIISRVSANDADLEVRQRAIQTLGIMIARTGSQDSLTLLSNNDHILALNLLCDRLKNETTRLAAVHAIDTIALLRNTKNQLQPEWIREVSLELSAQFRKADRSLRGASLGALKNLLVTSSVSSLLDSVTIKNLVAALLPLLTSIDLHLLAPALYVLASLVENDSSLVVSDRLNSALCELLKVNLGSSVIEALLQLIKNIGSHGAGQGLMSGLLNYVNVNGDPAVVGKVIGTLLVYGGPSVGVSIKDFLEEVNNANSGDIRRCLALAVLGEAGLCLGDKAKLSPSTFIAQFSTESDKVRLASAVALGRAGAGNIQHFLPEIIKAMSCEGNAQYLLLHSIKEIIQQASNNRASIMEYIQLIWNQLISLSQIDENKGVGAECIGRLVIISPKMYLPEIQSYLSDPKPSVRAMAIQAIRYTLVDGDTPFEKIISKSIVDILSAMLRDNDIENRRLALATLNSAAHNKPGLVIPNLTELLPFVMHESVVKPELIREVPMGPFKHKIDDGLEVRKSAYETLYSLMDIAFSRLSILTFYDRILAGLRDQHEIRALCNLILTKLLVLDPEETARRLDSIADAFRSILSVKLKDNAVKQEIEKQEEAVKGVLRVTLLLHETIPRASAALGTIHDNQGWRTYWEWVEKDFDSYLRNLKEEIRLVE
ncbi:Cullin-associated NEDD8-dissociated protein 1, C-terminal part [Erysiphe necator]|nr:Cullin-associated NEDD8-dissociated protein 1, C-terminal part [Erysiphe necator]